MASREETLKARSLSEVLPNSQELGKKPDVLFGCNTSELSFISIVSIVPGFFIGIAAGFAFGIQFFPIFMFGIFTVVGWSLVRFFRRIKRQKPAGYYMQSINRKLSKVIASYPIIEHEGTWQTNRLKPRQ